MREHAPHAQSNDLLEVLLASCEGHSHFFFLKTT